ncbi:hypothetical protein BJX70DRAFT_179967 [Aspergillus crustosus]
MPEKSLIRVSLRGLECLTPPSSLARDLGCGLPRLREISSSMGRQSLSLRVVLFLCRSCTPSHLTKQLFSASLIPCTEHPTSETSSRPVDLIMKTTTAIAKMYADEPGLPVGWTPTEAELATYGAYWKRSIEFHTDVTETCSRRQTLHAFADTGATAYSARINILAPGSPARLGSHHAVELDYVFDNVDETVKGLRDMGTRMSRV